MELKVGLKYCGHCQPRMLMSEFTRALAGIVPGICYTAWDNFGDYQVLLVLNACVVQCATVPEVNVPKLIVGFNTLNHHEYNSCEELLEETARQLLSLSRNNKNYSKPAK